jgi:hypothetical protein
MERKIIRISTLRHKGSDLLLAYSDDLKGLAVHGRSHEELERKIPLAIKDLLEADGYEVKSVELQREKEDEETDFIPTALIASASFCSQHDHRRVLASH